jgi:hypothetical protein
MLEYGPDAERNSAEKFMEFISENEMDIESWESTMFDRYGTEHENLPLDQSRLWPLTFTFKKKQHSGNSSDLLGEHSAVMEVDEEKSASGGCTPMNYCLGSAPFCYGSANDCPKSQGLSLKAYYKKCPYGGATCWFGYKVECQKCTAAAPAVPAPTPAPILKIITNIIDPAKWVAPPPPPPAAPAPPPGTVIAVADAKKALNKSVTDFAKAHKDYVNSSLQKHSTFEHIQKLLAEENNAKYNYTWFRNRAIDYAARKTELNQTARRLLRKMYDAQVEERIHAAAAVNMKHKAQNARINITYYQKALIDNEEALDYYRTVYDNAMHARDRAQRQVWQAQAIADQKLAMAKSVNMATKAVQLQNTRIAQQNAIIASKEKAYMASAGLVTAAEVPAWVGYR